MATADAAQRRPVSVAASALRRRMDPKFLRVTAELAPRIERPKFPLKRVASLLREPISYGTSSRLSIEPPGFPVLRMSNLTGDGWDLAEVKYLDVETPPEAWLLQRGDVVVNRTNSEELVGKAALFDLDADPTPWLYASYLLRLRVDEKQMVPGFLVAFLNSPVGRLQVDRVSRRAVGMANINTTEIGNFVVPVPTLLEQKAFLSRVTGAFEDRMTQIERARSVLLSTDAEVLASVGVNRTPEVAHRSYSVTGRVARVTGRLGAQFFHPERAAALQAVRDAPIGSAEPLGQVADFVSDRCTPAVGDRYIGLSAIEPHTGELLPVADEASDAKRFRRGDVLFGRLRPYLNKVHLAEADGVCSTEFYVLRPREDIDGGFLAIALRSSLALAQTKHMMTGNTHPRVVEADAKQLLLRFPEMDVQRSLVSIFAARRQKALGLRQAANEAWHVAQVEFDEALLG